MASAVMESTMSTSTPPAIAVDECLPKVNKQSPKNPPTAASSSSKESNRTPPTEVIVPKKSPQTHGLQQPMRHRSPLQASPPQAAMAMDLPGPSVHLPSPPPAAPMQEVYQAQQQEPMNTPWALGSSDGSLATQIALLQQQQLRLAHPGVETFPEIEATLAALANQQSLHQESLFQYTSAGVETLLQATCQVLHLDIAELWLRTGPKTHQLVHSHVRPTALLETSVRNDLVHVYYGDSAAERTHRLSPALCKRAKEARDVIWVTAATDAEALRQSISNVRTAVAVPICHEASNTNLTLLLFSMRRIVVKPVSVELVVHMALGVGVASVNSLGIDACLSRSSTHSSTPSVNGADRAMSVANSTDSENSSFPPLQLPWKELENVEYLTDGGTSWIHTAVWQGHPVAIKTLKPECQDVVVAIREMEGELAVHCRLKHPHVCPLLAAGTTKRGVRFLVVERLDGGTLTQRLGYDTRIRDRRRRFWKKKQVSFLEVLEIGKSIAQAMVYCHEDAMPGSIVLHRDLKPDNIGFSIDGTVKVFDFGLAKVIENASVDSDQSYTMSGETGSLRYMAPEVADGLPYNGSVDVYSFGIILWELTAGKKPFEGLNRELFYERIVHGGERPPLSRKFPADLSKLVNECWDASPSNRPRFRDIVSRMEKMYEVERERVGGKKKKKMLPKITGMIDRHSTWF